MQITEPKVVERTPQPYAAIPLEVLQSEIGMKAPQLIGDVIAWLKQREVKTVGAPFFDYVDFHPDGRMSMLVGMPTERLVEGDQTIKTGTLPGGRYASLTHTGPYHELGEANMALDQWGRQHGHKFDGIETPQGFRDATRLEIYHKDPGEDPSGHPVTEVAFALKS